MDGVSCEYLGREERHGKGPNKGNDQSHAAHMMGGVTPQWDAWPKWRERKTIF